MDARAVTPIKGKAADAQPTLFIECTHTYHSSMNTGIQRVVRNILRNAEAAAEQYGYAVVPVIFEHDRFIYADPARLLVGNPVVVAEDPEADEPPSTDLAPPEPSLVQKIWRRMLYGLAALLPSARARTFLFATPNRFGLAWCILLPARLLGLRPWPAPPPEIPGIPHLDRLTRCDNTILLLLDSSWNYPIWPAVQRYRERGGLVVGVIYDLIPVTHRHTSVPELTMAFDAWLSDHVRHSHAFIGISRSTAEHLAAFVARDNHGTRLAEQPRIDHFLLGSELDLIAQSDDVRPHIKRMFPPDEHSFLMVGSIEPRKNHGYVLDAFEAFWQQGGTASLVIVGRYGWKNEDIIERITNHPLFDRLLFLERDASDSDLDFAYHNASALVIASEIEGFGLPVVEAFQRGLPVLCSDIPVFREIAEGKATFFELADARNLTEALLHFTRENDARQHRARHPQPWITWRESTDQLFAAVMRVLADSAEPVRAVAET